MKQKKLLIKKFLASKNGVKNVQTAGYNGMHTVWKLASNSENLFTFFKSAVSKKRTNLYEIVQSFL